jgi:acyl-CoA reductase-like NAD-dependent aldehyde dehydrogenase
MSARANLVGEMTREMGAAYEVISPVTGTTLDRVALLGKEEIAALLARLSGPPKPLAHREVFAFLHRFREQLVAHRDVLLERTVFETGFTGRDCSEMVDGAVEFLKDFETYAHDQSSRSQVIRHSYSTLSQRDMRITDRPFRCVAAVVPQNASLTLGITIIASALYAGSRIVLRPSLQCASTGALLADIVRESDPPWAFVEIVNSLASDFLDACLASDSVDLIHYIGSNQYALPVFQQAFAAGKICLLDGQGNGLLYLDRTFPQETAVELITSGATRFNGETCTSVNGVLIEESAYVAVREALVESFRQLRVGSPLEETVQIGPLFSEKQAVGLRRTLQDTPNGRILCGGTVNGAYFTPAIIEGVDMADAIAREGFFGPCIWIHPVRQETLWKWIRANRFPLSDTVLATRKDLIRNFARNSRAARICVNQDPSVESMFEPWGGYPPSGFNPVSVWMQKYRQTFQLDGRLSEILGIPSDHAPDTV